MPKVLLLNGSHDRETSAGLEHGGLMAAADVVKAICSALNRDHNRHGAGLRHAPSAYVTAMLVPRGGAIAVDLTSLAAIGIRCAVRHHHRHTAPELLCMHDCGVIATLDVMSLCLLLPQWLQTFPLFPVIDIVRICKQYRSGFPLFLLAGSVSTHNAEIIQA